MDEASPTDTIPFNILHFNAMCGIEDVSSNILQYMRSMYMKCQKDGVTVAIVWKYYSNKEKRPSRVDWDGLMGELLFKS